VPPGGFGDFEGSLTDIYAARLDASGALIDSVPIVVAQDVYDQAFPRVAWNGQNWFVVFNAQRTKTYSTSIDVAGVRVSSAGQVLDTPPIVIKGAEYIDEYYPAVSSDGTNWVVLWMDQGAYFQINAARVTNSGTILDPGGVPIYTPSFPDAPYSINLAFAQDEFLVTWQEVASDAVSGEVRGMRITPALQRLDAVPFRINAYTPSDANRPNVASNGTGFFVVWGEERAYGYFRLYGTRVTPAGQVADPRGIQITGDSGYTNFTPSVTWDGTMWVVAYNKSVNFSSDDIFTTRVAANGRVRDRGVAVKTTPFSESQPVVVGLAIGGARVFWTDVPAGGTWPQDIYGASISPTGVPGPDAPMALGAPRQIHGDVAAGGLGYLTAFVSEISGETRIMAQRLDAQGNALDAEPLRLAGGSPYLSNPSVAWNGSLSSWRGRTRPRDRRMGSAYSLTERCSTQRRFVSL
jgi:hypothetical protein